MTFELSPPVPRKKGLEAKLEWLAEQIYQKYGILSLFENDGLAKPVEKEMEILLFQAVRELLVNVVKHSKAGSVKVTVKRDGSNLRIEVEDNGKGFNSFRTTSYNDEAAGYGLFSIKERLDILGGRLEIDSETGEGARVTLTAPLAETEDD